MFNKNFYPTPKEIIEKMIELSEVLKKPLPGLKILEPSAGKGDIIEYINRKYINYDINISAIEIEPELQAILKTKKCKLIAYDFLKYSTNTLYDLIIMNPPFSEGVKHLLKAIEIMKTGEIICLLNSQTIENLHSFERKKLKEELNKHNAKIIKLSDCFKNAERKSNVDTVMIYINKNEELQSNILKDLKYQKKNIEELEIKSNAKDLMTSDIIRQKVDTYNAFLKTIPKAFECLRSLKSYGFGIRYTDIADLMFSAMSENIETSYKKFYNKSEEIVRKNAWESVFRDTKIAQTLTQKTREELELLKKERGDMEFNSENIDNLIEILYLNKNKILESCIIEAFDYLTKYHKENRVHVEGWKTNDKYKVNRKFILPFVIEIKKYGNYESWGYNYSTLNKLDDLDRAICHIAGINYGDIFKKNITISEIIREDVNKERNGYFDWIESEFFKIRYYKKGTAHFIFKDEYFWKMFNLIACKGKNWLPKNNTKEQNLLLLGNSGNVK